MSRHTPTAASYADAVLLDDKINEIREAMDTISWLSYSFGRAYKGVEVADSRIVYPEVFQAYGYDYLNLMPCDMWNYSFVWVRQPQTVISQQKGTARGTYTYEANLSVIVFYQRSSIGTTIRRPFDEELKYDCMYALGNVHELEVTNVFDDVEECFSDFTTSRIEAEYMSRDFGALRFDVTVRYSNNCKITNSY